MTRKKRAAKPRPTDGSGIDNSRLNALFTQGPAVVYTTAAHGDFGSTFVSENMETLFGHPAKEFLKSSTYWESHVHPEDKARIPDMRSRLKEGETVTVEYRIRHANGEYRWVSDTQRLICDEDGSPMEIVGTVLDITERKIAEIEHKNDMERLKILFDFAPDAYYISDLAGTFVDGNLAAELLVGYNKEELIGKSFLKLKLLSAKEIVKAARLLAQSARGKSTGPDEFTLHRSDDKQVRVEISTYPVTFGGTRYVLGIARDISERVKSEEEQKENASLLSSIMESIEEGILVLNAHGQVAFNNKQFADMWHLPEDFASQLGERNALRIALKRMSRPAEFITKNKRLSDNPLDTEGGELSTTGGSMFEWYSRPHTMERNLLGRIWVFRDVTEKKIREEQLAQFQTAIDLSSDGVVLVDIGNRRFVDVNKEVEKKTGYSREEILALDPLELQSGLEQAEYEKTLAAIRSAKDGLVLETQIRRKDRTVFPVEMSVKFIATERRNLLIGIFRDVTERKKAERELRLLNASVASLNDIVLITDRKGNIEYVNEAFERVTGYSQDEVLGRNPRFLQSGKVPQSTYESLWETILAGRPWYGVLINRRKNGQLFYEDVQINAVKDNDEIAHFVAVKRDISDRIALEEGIARMRTEQERFMRHEMANILGPIQSFGELLSMRIMDGLDESAADLLESMIAASQKANQLIDKLRQLHDIEHGNQEISRRKGDLGILMSGVISEAKSLLEAAAVTVDYENSAENNDVMMDYDLLPGVFFNLLKNAVEHVQNLESDEEKIVGIHVDNEGGNVCVRINNRGKPLPPSFQNTFFEKFNSQRGKTGGTGLGTSYAKLVVDAHDGEINVESDAENGTTVMVVLETC